MDWQVQAKKRRPKVTEAKLKSLLMREGIVSYGAAMEVKIRPSFRDLESDEAVRALYHRWCCHYNICRTPAERGMKLGIFHKNAIHVFEMSKMDPSVSSCEFHLSSSCDEKDLFDPSDDERKTLTPTEKDLEPDEAVWDLYYRWCLYHTLLRTPEEMEQRFNNFKRSAFYAVKLNQKGPSSNSGLSMWCDKIDLRYPSGVEERTLEERTFAPTKGDMESDEALWDLYRRWRGHHKIHRTAEEMKWAFMSFKKSATYAFEMSQKHPTVQFGLSMWCDETDTCFHEVKIIPTERDLKSGNALLGLYHRYCRSYRRRLSPPKEMQQRFYDFKKGVYHVFEKNKRDPFHPFYLSHRCDKEDAMLDEAAAAICVVPTFRDLGSDEAVMALYLRWSLKLPRPRTPKEMGERLDNFKKEAQEVFKHNIERPGSQGLIVWCDGFC